MPGADKWIEDEQRAQHLEERSRDGYSRQDWWNFDHYIAEVIASAVLKFSTEGHGFFVPIGYGFDPESFEPTSGAEEAFHSLCKDIHDKLMRYVEHDYLAETWEEEQQIVEDAKDAMHQFATYFGNWWD
jgi:hypothetical protein